MQVGFHFPKSHRRIISCKNVNLDSMTIQFMKMISWFVSCRKIFFILVLNQDVGYFDLKHSYIMVEDSKKALLLCATATVYTGYVYTGCIMHVRPCPKLFKMWNINVTIGTCGTPQSCFLSNQSKRWETTLLIWWLQNDSGKRKIGNK